MMPGVVLETERLAMRRMTADDAPLLFGLDSDPEVMRFINGGLPTPREEVESEILPSILSRYERCGGSGVLIAAGRDSGDFIGWFSLQSPDGRPREELELGYRLKRSVWGRGYATEGSKALIRAAFTRFGATKVFAETMSVNTRSRSVMEKAGLRFVRTFFADWPHAIEGSEYGDVEYAVGRGEWAAGEPAAS